jgi:S1-C subfamily serine protease
MTPARSGDGGGLGYAVPINQVRRIAQAIVTDGHASHPYIGVGLRELGAAGVLVSRVGRDTPAARAGLRPGDVITAVGDLDMPVPAELVTLIERQPIGTRVAVAFTRGGRNHRVVVPIEDIPID